VCCSMLQRVAACCSALQCVAVCYAHFVRYTDPICVAACCSVLQCVAVCCSALQCVAVCCAHLVRHTVPIRRGERILAFADLLEEHRCGIVIKWREPTQHDVQHHTCVRVCVSVCVCVCAWSRRRTAWSHRMPYLHRSFSAKEPYN